MEIEATALNADILAEAQNDRRSDILWSQVLDSQVVLLSPELLQSDTVRVHLSLDKPEASFQDRCTLLVCDEAHLVYIWGRHFRKPYREIGQMRNRLQSRVRLLLLTATLRIDGPLQYVQSCFDLRPQRFIDIHQSNLRPEIRVTTSILESTLATAFMFPELQWVHGLPGVTIIFAPDRSTALRLTLYLRRLHPSQARKVRKYDALNDRGTYDKETMSLVEGLDSEHDWLVIVATSILMVGVDLRGVKCVVILEPLDFDEELQKEGRLLRSKVSMDDTAESYVYVSRRTMEKAYELVSVARNADTTLGNQTGEKRKRHKPNTQTEGNQDTPSLDLSMAKRLVAQCRTEEQNRQYANPPYGRPPCTCSQCSRAPLPLDPPCLCSGCQPGKSKRDLLAARHRVSLEAAQRAFKMGFGIRDDQNNVDTVITVESQEIVRKYLIMLDLELFNNDVANPGGLYTPGMLVSPPVITAIIANLPNLETPQKLAVLLKDHHLREPWLQAIWSTLVEKVVPMLRDRHIKKKAEAEDGRITKHLGRLNDGEIERLVNLVPTLDITDISPKYLKADLIWELYWHGVWCSTLPKQWKALKKESLITLLSQMVEKFNNEGRKVEEVRTKIQYCHTTSATS